MKKAHVTHPELKCTFCLDIIGVKKNPNGQTYTALGVITKGTIIEVNVSELGLVTPGGKVVWGKYAQVIHCDDPFIDLVALVPGNNLQSPRLLCSIRTECWTELHEISRTQHRLIVSIWLSVQVTNNPENDGCINGVLLV